MDIFIAIIIFLVGVIIGICLDVMIDNISRK